MKEEGLSHLEIGKELGLSGSSVSRWIRGLYESTPSEKIRKKRKYHFRKTAGKTNTSEERALVDLVIESQLTKSQKLNILSTLL